MANKGMTSPSMQSSTIKNHSELRKGSNGGTFNKATFRSGDQSQRSLVSNTKITPEHVLEVRSELRNIINECYSSQKDGKICLKQLEQLITEANIKNQGFEQVYRTLLELESTEATVIETLFYYKINGIDEFNQEAADVTKAYQQGQLDPDNNATQGSLQKSFIKRMKKIRKMRSKRQ